MARSWNKLKAAAMLLSDEITGRLLPRGRLTGDVLVVRLDAIGDFVVWMDAAEALVRCYRQQGRSVVLAANALWAPWAATLGIFDDVIPVERKRWAGDLMYRLNLTFKVRSRGFATVIHPSYFREWLGDAIVRVSGADERIGSTGDQGNMRKWQSYLESRSYTRLVPCAAGQLTEHEQNAHFARQVFDSGYRATLANLTGLRAGEAPAVLQDVWVGEKRPYFVVSPSASRSFRMWPPERYGQLAERIHQTTGWLCVVCGGPDDGALAEAVCLNAGSAPTVNLAGRTSLADLAKCFAHAKLVLTNDTAAAHLGPATGTPTVCLLGGGHFGRFLPYALDLQTNGQPLPRNVVHPMPCFGCDWRCIYPVAAGDPVPCIANIALETAWKTVQACLLELPRH